MSDEAQPIGIDLGTTNSCAAVLIDDKIRLIHGDDGSNIMASFVFFEQSGECIVGNLAKDRSYKNPKNAIFGVKRFIGRSYEEFKNEECLSTFQYQIKDENNKPVIIVDTKQGTKSYNPEEISAMVLTQLKARAEEVLRKTVTKAVITVPAHFNGVQRQATIDAGKIAGLEVLRIINEPTAAALAYEIDNKYHKKSCNVLVYDFGGGTFDVSIVKIHNGNIEVIVSNGDVYLGGDDIDNNLVKYFSDDFYKKHKIDLKSNSLKAMNRLRQQAEKTKIWLSTTLEHTAEVDCIDGTLDLECTITRSLLERLNKDLFNKTITCIEKSMNEAKMSKKDIDEILLVGGSTRIPYVRKIVSDYFGKAPNASVHPDEVVAIGAARKAIQCSNNKINTGLTAFKLVDVCSLSLGTDLVDGTNDVIIPRNTKLPAKKTRRYYTVYDNQEGIDVGIYEGERLMSEDNHFLANFELTGIRLAKARGVAVDVTFDVNENGILTATAEEVGAENSAQIRVDIHKNNLSQKEIQDMIAKAEKLRVEDENKKARAIQRYELDKNLIII